MINTGKQKLKFSLTDYEAMKQVTKEKSKIVSSIGTKETSIMIYDRKKQKWKNH